MSNLVKVINNKERYFNGARKGQIITIDKNRLNYYLKNGFSLIEEKQNIVHPKTNQTSSGFPGIDDAWTINQLKEKLDHLGVKHDECKVKTDFQKLLSDALQKPVETENNDESKNTDIDSLKIKLISEKIVEESELEGKTDEEILQIATDNGLI